MKRIILIGIIALLSSVTYSQVKVVTPKVKVIKPKKVLKPKKKKPAPTSNYRKRPGRKVKVVKKDYVIQFTPFKPEEN